MLAIAGLIFLMVFIALPALQRNQRDTQRKNQVATILDAYERCKINNRGACIMGSSVSSDLATYNMLVSNYLQPDDVKDPSTGLPFETIGWNGTAENTDNIGVGQLAFDLGAECNDGGLTDYPASDPRNRSTVAIVIRLESGGTYCVSNNNQ